MNKFIEADAMKMNDFNHFNKMHLEQSFHVCKFPKITIERKKGVKIHFCHSLISKISDYID